MHHFIHEYGLIAVALIIGLECLGLPVPGETLLGAAIYAATKHDLKMLENMFIGRPPGNYDRLLDFSFPKTGNLFFVPSATFLADVAVADDTASVDTAPPEALASAPASPNRST